MLRNLGLTVAVGMLLSSAALETRALPAQPSQAKAPDVVYVGTPYDVVARMLKMARVRTGDVLYDLGCGDGRIVVLAAQKYGCRGSGFDIDAERVSAARVNARRNRVSHLVTIIQADLFTVDFQEADVLALYLLPEINTKLLPKFRTLKPGARLIFHNYDLEGIEADESISFISNEDGASHTLFLYTTPLKPEKK